MIIFKCQNNGVCLSTGTSYTCKCQAGFTGPKCDTCDPCTPSPVIRNLTIFLYLLLPS